MLKGGAAIFLPDSDQEIRYDAANLEAFTQLEDYWMKREGLIFYPFNRNDKAYFFSVGDNQNVAKEFTSHRNAAISKEEYTTSILIAQDQMRNSEMDKVVLARNKVLTTAKTPEEIFTAAHYKYPSSYAYMVCLEEETWVGASPELLLKYRDGKIHTVALAGTKILAEDFEEKEHEEQAMVESFVEDKLREVGLLDYQKSDKEEAKFGQIKHLRTNYSAAATQEQAMELVRHLQPTSAVCGLPRDMSFGFIQEFETMHRGFYAGVTGVLRKDEITFFVNLRCMRFKDGQVEVFAGAGITKDSNAELEWLETERKTETVAGLL